jgi:NAD+---dinitrogen-reductase ADP-D-ribosyltransferase
MTALYSTCDKAPALCRNDDKGKGNPSLPKSARLPINRCNLPAVVLGSLTFQRHPTALVLDGVAELHRDLFERLDRLKLPHQRATVFTDYITVAFRLEHPEEIGLTDKTRKSRAKATWARILRGWAFDPDSREAAVLKGWVESRFGLTARHHIGSLHDRSHLNEATYYRFEAMRADGLYGTNALESQLDLVFAYCQYEFARQEAPTHLRLYRGVNRVDAHEVLDDAGTQRVLLLNNISSFSSDRERAGEFGDYILCVDIPIAKVLFHCALLPGVWQGEGEYLVIGGAYEVSWATL